MNKIQMVDLTTQYSRMKGEIDEALLGVVRSGQYINGEEVRLLAEELVEYTGAQYVIPCGNGTDALQMALMALELNEGDEVIVPAFTYAACVEAIILLKLVPVVIDVDPQTFNMDATKIEEALSSRTRAIIPVHLFGQCCDMEPILRLARRHKLYVIEDNAQSIGSIYTFSDGTRKQAGTMGDIGTLSFFPTKNLGCYGDGGAMMTNDPGLAYKLQSIGKHGQSRKYIHERIGCNSRLDTLQAAILRVKLRRLNDYIQARQSAASVYQEGLKSLTGLLELPRSLPASTHVYHQFTLRVKNGRRDALQAYLKEQGVPSTVYYPLSIAKQPAFRFAALSRGSLAVTEKLTEEVLSLPMHTELSDEQLAYIIQQIQHYE